MGVQTNMKFSRILSVFAAPQIGNQTLIAGDQLKNNEIQLGALKITHYQSGEVHFDFYHLINSVLNNFIAQRCHFYKAWHGICTCSGSRWEFVSLNGPSSGES